MLAHALALLVSTRKWQQRQVGRARTLFHGNPH